MPSFHPDKPRVSFYAPSSRFKDRHYSPEDLGEMFGFQQAEELDGVIRFDQNVDSIETIASFAEEAQQIIDHVLDSVAEVLGEDYEHTPETGESWTLAFDYEGVHLECDHLSLDFLVDVSRDLMEGWMAVSLAKD